MADHRKRKNRPRRRSRAKRESDELGPWHGPFTEEMAREIEWSGTPEGQRAIRGELQEMIKRAQERAQQPHDPDSDNLNP